MHTDIYQGVNINSLSNFLAMYIKDHHELLNLKHDLMCNSQ